MPFPNPLDIIIPTLKSREDVAAQVAEITETAGCPVNVIATCQHVSAAANRNIGLDQSTSDPLIMLDDDITGFPQGWAKQMTELMLGHPNCVMLSPELMAPNGKLGIMMGGPPRGGTGVEVVPSRKLVTACFAFRRDDIRFDEAFIGSGFEDDDFSAQLRQRYPDGVWLICHDIRVVHLNEMKNQAAPFEVNKRHYQEKWSTKW